MQKQQQQQLQQQIKHIFFHFNSKYFTKKKEKHLRNLQICTQKKFLFLLLFCPLLNENKFI